MEAISTIKKDALITQCYIYLPPYIGEFIKPISFRNSLFIQAKYKKQCLSFYATVTSGAFGLL